MKINKIILIASIFYSNFLLAYCANISVNINNINTPDGNWIVLANGSWNSWGWGVELSDQDGDGTYEGSVCGLADGTYGYVHTITGDFDNWSGWGMVSNAPYNSPCDFIPNDQWYNYGFEINEEDIATQLNSNEYALTFGIVFILVGLAFKISAVPFHMWAADVYE